MKSIRKPIFLLCIVIIIVLLIQDNFKIESIPCNGQFHNRYIELYQK